MATHKTMTVGQLVEKLQKLPQNLSVHASDGSQYGSGILAHSGVAVINTNIGEVVFIGNGDGELATASMTYMISRT